MAEAEILILDEPTSALDLKNQTLILDWIARLSRDNGLTIVMTTHHPHHALAVAGRVHLMLGDANHIVGRPESVLTEENLIALYGVPMKRVEFDYEGQHFETLAHVLPISRSAALVK